MNAQDITDLHLDQASMDASWDRALQLLRDQGEDVDALMKRAIRNVERLREPRLLQDTAKKRLAECEAEALERLRKLSPRVTTKDLEQLSTMMCQLAEISADLVKIRNKFGLPS